MASKYVADGWAIATRNGRLLKGSVAASGFLRKFAIGEFLLKNPRLTWKDAYQAGYRCVRVYRKVEAQ